MSVIFFCLLVERTGALVLEKFPEDRDEIFLLILKIPVIKLKKYTKCQNYCIFEVLRINLVKKLSIIFLIVK